MLTNSCKCHHEKMDEILPLCNSSPANKLVKWRVGYNSALERKMQMCKRGNSGHLPTEVSGSELPPKASEIYAGCTDLLYQEESLASTALSQPEVKGGASCLLFLGKEPMR